MAATKKIVSKSCLDYIRKHLPSEGLKQFADDKGKVAKYTVLPRLSEKSGKSTIVVSVAHRSSGGAVELKGFVEGCPDPTTFNAEAMHSDDLIGLAAHLQRYIKAST